MFKVVVLAFPLVGEDLAWKVGDGIKVILGKDPWGWE
jgi:hypothetical protein